KATNSETSDGFTMLLQLSEDFFAGHNSTLFRTAWAGSTRAAVDSAEVIQVGDFRLAHQHMVEAILRVTKGHSMNQRAAHDFNPKQH
ncbi:MAG: hypothetical protein V2B18_19285, partial [Pseudomonadota bacterium]